MKNKNLRLQKEDDFISEIRSAGVKNLTVVEVPAINNNTHSNAFRFKAGRNGTNSGCSTEKKIGADDVLFISITGDGIRIF